MINPGIMSSNTPEWSTPQWLFDALNNIFHFTLDPCSTRENAKCEKHYTLEENGLNQKWVGERVFMNPPYGRAIGDWVKKCYLSACDRVCKVALLPARTDTRWFHDYVYDKAKIYFIKGRLKFGDGKGSAPFPSMIATWQVSDDDFKVMQFRLIEIFHIRKCYGDITVNYKWDEECEQEHNCKVCSPQLCPKGRT